MLSRSDNNSFSRKFFRYGMFLIPFENFIFAPSAGWPAISPLFFFVAFVFLPKNKYFTRQSFRWVVALVVLSLIGYFLSHGISIGNRYLFRDVSAALAALIFGYAFYSAMSFHFIKNNNIDYDNCRAMINSFVRGSFWALSFSLLILVFNNLLKVGSFIQVSSFILKRNIESGRFQFLFAEPSFISVHILGVLVPLAWLCWRLNFSAERKSILRITFAYLFLSLLFANSARFLIDFFVLSCAGFLFYIYSSFSRLNYKKVFLLLIFPMLILFLSIADDEIFSAVTNDRLSYSGDFRFLINSDPSLASRFFRIDAVYNGLSEYSYFLVTGVGFGNIGSLVDFGYDRAISNFYSLFFEEVDYIRINGNGPNIFNMHLRIIGEFGLIFFLILLYKVFNRKTAFLFFVIMWCYVQFDSYAFYAVWIYLVINKIVQVLDGKRVFLK